MSASADRPPSVDKLARSIADVGLPHPMLVDAARAAIAAGAPDSARSIAVATSRRMLRPVINATGTILHTNLGRAPMAWEQPERYTNLELDLTTGQRGSRMATAGALIAKACGAEDAIIVNNCAAAVLLGLGGLAEGRDVAVSRSELVEIGGGFRIPDVMARSGANLIEVGTTNRTRVDDFRGAVDDPNNDVAVVLRVHQSNYTIVGFTEAPTTAQLAGLNAPLVADIGSGLLDSRCPWLEGDPPGWLADEPAARQTLDGGAGLVMFSGDKLFGGPQAGIIAGDAELVRKCAAHPLARALRPGSLVLAALQATALAYLAEDGDAIPFWRMASLTVDQLRKRADAYGVGEIVDVMSTPGGGTLPGVEIPSVGVAVEGDQREALRELDHPIIARVDHGDSSAGETTVLDLRTIHPDDDEVVAGALRSLPSAT
ncbi:MAG: L-seryl-tRNA(Sec) selenium transferase [Actinomycetota bacterium]|nr:L-seryl-tRNA(Sec) selenium transferase [Acidimicrobiaceae bacterium]MEC7144858.1 L-seryl-tRNA(Sec) selenium transferase [Actinomycetota bacterium]MEC7403822.1 L-seryl-tRNA(Sec) selenium transferase [Actinomycetota bacterium]